MSQKLNCWQYKNCGRERGGLLADVLGVCPVSVCAKLDGLNEGRAGGRACWKVPQASMRCERTASGLGKPCHQCAFYLRVQYEQAEPEVATSITEISVSEDEDILSTSV